MALEEVYDYFRQYDQQTYQIAACAGNEQDIRRFEEEYQIRLPEEFRQFTLSPLGGLWMEVREQIWPRAKPFDVGPFWSFCRGVMVYGISDQIPEFLDIRVKTKELRDQGFDGLIPFLSIIGNGDEVFCFDRQNRVVLLDYCAEEEAQPVEGGFSDCLLEQIRRLEERKNRKLRGEDKKK